MTLLLRPDDHYGLVTISEAVQAVEDAFRAWGNDPTINLQRHLAGARNKLAVHQAVVPEAGVSGLLAHTWAQRSESAHHAASLIFSAATGELEAILVGQVACGPPVGSLEVRTAATSAVGTKALARLDARTVGVIGSGRQARTHLAATAAVRGLTSVKVYSRAPEHRERYAREMEAALDLEIRPVASAREAVEGVDIVLLVADAHEPVLFGNWLEPGQHVTSVLGGSTARDASGRPLAPPRRDADDESARRADVYVINSREQARSDYQGDIVLPIEAGAMTWDRLHELGEVLAGRAPGRASRDQITFYRNNGGQGIADVAIGALAVSRAREAGRGTQL